MLLEDSHIRLRALEPEDLETLYLWENNSDLWIHGNTLSPYSKMALRQYISNAMESDIYQNKQVRLMVVLKEDNSIIGTIDLYDFEPKHGRAGIGILIDEPFRQREYASKVLAIIKRYAFNFLHLHQLYAYIATNNAASIKLFEKADYKTVGILKDWIKNSNKYEDVVLLQLINETKE